ncbi:MAG: hypothetical protein R6X02_19585 [Enhygromyxa sp.]
MLSAHRLEQLLTQIKALPRPVASIYVESGDDGGRLVSDATRIRVRRVLTQLRAEHPSLDSRLEARIFDAIGHPGGRGTVAIFAGSADGAQPQIITRNLPNRLPIGNNGLAGEGQWGEPWLMPLRLALSETRRVALLHVHDQGVGAYESFLGDIEQITELTPPIMPGEDDSLHSSKTVHPAHIADRGNSGYDDAETHRIAWRRRFYVDASAELVPILAARSIDSVLLLGAPHNRQMFEAVAPSSLLAKVIGAGPGLPQQDARPPQILAAVREQLDEHLERRRGELLAKLTEHGVLGLEDCLAKLQRGQLQLLFVPWDLDGELFVELDTGQVATSPGQARALSGANNARISPVRARSKLVELADLYATEIEFIRGGGSRSPFDAVRGVAGLPRWT